jgi:KAP family P-loop domain/PASTA domain
VEAPSSLKASSPVASSGGRGGFYLHPRSKIGILGICLTLMIAASVYAVFQAVNPDPLDTSLTGRLWYPHESNPYARLPGVRCSNDYACRLNSVAVNSTGDLPEVWAVGNVGLVLHRRAGQRKWEQLTITAKAEKAPAATVTPTPAPRPAPSPARTATPTPTPAPVVTPPPGIAVPNLLGRSEDEARKMAAGSGFQLEVAYEGGKAPSPVTQGPAPDFRVVDQTPKPGTLAPEKSTIKVLVARSAGGKAGLLDGFETRVYAAELERRPQSSPQNGTQGNASPRPAITSIDTSVSEQPQSQPGSATLDDDLIGTNCSGRCRAVGRSGRIYTIGDGNEWSFTQATFTNTRDDSSIDSLSLKTVTGSGLLLALAGTTTYDCVVGSLHRDCNPEGFISTTKNGDLVLDGIQPRKGPTILSFWAVQTTKPLSEGLVVGDSGYIAKVQLDRGFPMPETHRPVLSGTVAGLRSISFDSLDPDQHGFVVGDHGIILSTSDGGKTWRHETQGPEGAAPNHRLPAVWYWVLAGLLIITSSVLVAVPPPPAPAELSVADWTVTDAPLKPGDVDSLGFTPMALGLSRFIRNPKTQPPVTIAIEGEWGEGKSSVMSLLRGDLEKSRFRPVWFNAWHHQSEEQLLAALLEHIKDQAVPPWWHLDNWIFRARLVYFRFQGKWPLVILLALALCGSLAYELSRHALALSDFTNFGKDAIALAKCLMPWSSQTKPPDDLSHFGLVATLIAIFATIFKKAQAFGINPAKLTDNLRDAATVKDIKPDPGVRPRFAREFGDVCEAWSWGGRRVIIFIDDLDRCRPESVVTVLESINFLTTAGDCMMVLGMAQNQVTHCVGLGFKDIAHAEAAYLGGGNTEQEKAVARFNYGAFYIKKLVNIVAPLPKTTPDQRRAVLEARAAEVRRQAEDDEQRSRAARWRAAAWTWASQAGSLTREAAPVLALVTAVVLSVLIGYKQGIQQKPPEPQAQAAPPQAHPGPAPVSQPPTREGAVTQALAYDRPTAQPATLVEPDRSAGGMWWSFAAGTLLPFILFGILAYQFSARTNQDAQNSPEFEESLKLWGQYMVGVCDTPREIKRALNDLRYQAMTRRNNGPSSTRGERLIRALRRLVTGRSEKMPVETRVDEAALPPHKAADLAALNEAELKAFLDPDILDLKGSENLQRLITLKREHIKHFQRWIGEAQPVIEPTALEAENPPPARAAHQA